MNLPSQRTFFTKNKSQNNKIFLKYIFAYFFHISIENGDFQGYFQFNESFTHWYLKYLFKRNPFACLCLYIDHWVTGTSMLSLVGVFSATLVIADYCSTQPPNVGCFCRKNITYFPQQIANSKHFEIKGLMCILVFSSF